MLKKFTKIYFQNRGIILIAVLALFLRLVWLGKFPIGITHDELNYIISAKSLFRVSHFAPGTAPAVFPTSMDLFTVTVAEIPSFILALTTGFLKLSLFNSRFIGALFSSLSVVLVYFIVLTLTNVKIYAITSSLVMAVNPWSFLMGRTIFEVNFFVFFFLAGMLVLLKNKGWRIFYALPLYILGFFSYVGGQIVFYLFMVITLSYHFFTQKKRAVKPYILFLGAATISLVAYMTIALRNQTVLVRGNELFLPTLPEIARQVDSERLTSVPSDYNKLFINKATEYLRGFFERYFDAFRTNTLFLKGEFRAAFSYQKHGSFYFIDLIFLILGVCVLFQLNKKVWGLLLSIIAISPITSGVSLVEHSYSQRSGLMFPFLIILVGIGVGYFVNISKNVVLKKTLSITTVFIYVLFFVNLLHTYFYRFPVYASDGWFYQDRLLSYYIELTKKNYAGNKVVVSTHQPKIVFQEHLFFTGRYDDSFEVVQINESLAKGKFSYGGVDFVSTCLEKEDIDESTVWIYESSMDCDVAEKEGQLRITRLKDVYANYLIQNDKVCQGVSVPRYVSPVSYRNFAVEGSAKEEFCSSWITKI